MQPYQQIYRIFSIIWGFMLFWNLFIAVGLSLSGVVYYATQMMWHTLLIWLIMSVIGITLSGLTIKGVPILKDFKTRLFLIIIMICIYVIPTLTLVL